MITKVQRNAMLEAVAKTDLNQSEFDLTFYPDDQAVRIDHMPTGSFFRVDESYDNYSITASVEGYPIRDYSPNRWSLVLTYLQKWIAEIKEDLGTPELWDELRRQREFLSETGYGASPNAPFTADERAEIAAQIRQIKEYLRENLSLPGNQLSDIETRLDEAEAASSRVNRKDWLLLFLGVIFTLVISGLLTPEAVQHIFGMAVHGLGHLYSASEKPLGLPSAP